MDSCGVVRDAVVFKRNAGITGRFVFRLISIYLASSAPAFALDQGGVSASAQRDTERLLLASLDPKHDNYRDDDDGDRDYGRDHRGHDDDQHRGRDDDHDHDHRHDSGGGSCPRDPTDTPMWNSAVSNTGLWNTASDWTGTSIVPSGSTAIAEFAAAKVFTVTYNTTSTVGALQFDAGSPAYTFNIGSGYALTLAGVGIDNRSSNTPVFNVTGHLNFINSASASNAALIANSGGVIDFSGVTSRAATAGSIAGAGTYVLGRINLTVGSLGASTTVSGV